MNKWSLIIILALRPFASKQANLKELEARLHNKMPYYEIGSQLSTVIRLLDLPSQANIDLAKEMLNGINGEIKWLQSNGYLNELNQVMIAINRSA